jgi:protoporphyrinogen IX oxidase
MNDILIALYPWIKAFHVMAVISWMAGLFYLPRLFVHHVEQTEASDSVFMMMEEKLLRVIMTPAMVASWLFGLLLVFTPGMVDWAFVWPWAKAGAVLAMTWFHFWLAARRRDLAAGNNRVTGRRFRMMNEVPTVLMVVIVLAVIVKF